MRKNISKGDRKEKEPSAISRKRWL